MNVLSTGTSTFSQDEMRHTDSIDVLRLFFEDVARLPIIGGKRDYLPLTRRIRRGQTLLPLGDASQPSTFDGLVRALSEALGRFESQCRRRGRPPLDVSTLAMEIEPFLDDSGVATPASLLTCLGKPKRNRDEETESFETLGWQCFYLLSLLPPSKRPDYLQAAYDDQAAFHFFIIESEAREALTRLTEGTLRYVINNAVSYTGRGVPFLDLVQEGVLGLQIAATKFHERKGHFQQYAAGWIRQRISRYIADNGNLIRIPVHVADKLSQAISQQGDADDILDFDSFVAAMGLNEVDMDGDEDDVSILTAQDKSRRAYRAYLIAAAPHLSLERTRLPSMDDSEEPWAFEDVLVATEGMEADQESRSDAQLVRRLLQQQRIRINDRNWDMLMLRLGFADGQEHTLEQVGQRFGVTRERVRQIEAKFWKALEYGSSNSPMLQTLARRPRRRGGAALVSPTTLRDVLDGATYTPQAVAEAEAEAIIRRLIDRYVERGRPKVWDVNRLSGRKALFREVLLELGEPTHYSMIHERALERVASGLHFTKESTYTTLFYGDRVFRSHGNAVFGLVEWPVEETTADGEVVFDHCPEPLLPPDALQSAFFDSIEYARQLLKRQPLSADVFWRAMVGWSGAGVDDAAAQAAFDAWYAAGLLERVYFASANGARVVLTAPPDTGLDEMRRHCLASLCRRVSKMPELLLALAMLGRPTVPQLQVALFGSEWAGYDVPTRLRLLAALGAARQTGREWRLTDDGRAALAAFPKLELPDAPGEDEAAHDDDDDDDLLELDAYELDQFALS